MVYKNKHLLINHTSIALQQDHDSERTNPMLCIIVLVLLCMMLVALKEADLEES